MDPDLRDVQCHPLEIREPAPCPRLEAAIVLPWVAPCLPGWAALCHPLGDLCVLCHQAVGKCGPCPQLVAEGPIQVPRVDVAHSVL